MEGTMNSENIETDRIKVQNEKCLHDIEYDLEDILNKLQKLTSSGNNSSSPHEKGERVVWRSRFFNRVKKTFVFV